MRKPATVVAIDKDRKWSSGRTELEERFDQLGASVEFRHGAAEALPFPDDSFEVVTCQTVLIHCPDPEAALQEMKRVAKPGGIVICAEPNNLIGTASLDSIEQAADVDTLVDKYRERLLYERGRQAAGEGNISLGDQLSYLFSRAGFRDIQSYLSDRLNPPYPPYDRPEQQAEISQAREMDRPEDLELKNAQNRRYVAALNDADAAAFVQHRKHSAQTSKVFLEAVDNGTYSSSGLSAMYIVSGRK